MRLRLMSDVPLGMFLSGGLDSSAIAAIMARMIDRPLQTFSVAFKERAFSELTWAREVAQAIGADAHEVVIGADQFFDALPRLVWHEDEPIAHPSSVPLYFVSALAREHVTVVLTGEGSDELLAGYGKYPRALLNWRAGGDLRARDAGRGAPLVRRARHPGPARPRGALRRDDRSSASSTRRRRRSSTTSRRCRSRASASCSTAVCARAPRVSGRTALTRAGSIGRRAGPLLDRLLYADIKTYLVELLMKQDQMSMAASIESRVPFLDHKLVEFVATMPARVEALRVHDEARAARGGEGPAARVDPPPPEDGVPGAVRASGRADPGDGVVRDVLLDRRARERGLFDAGAGHAAARRSRRRPHRRRRHPLEPSQSRALVSHLDRRRRRAAPRRAVSAAATPAARRARTGRQPRRDALGPI